MKSNHVLLSAGLATTLLQEVFHKELSLHKDQVLNLGSPEMRKLRCFLFENDYLDKGAMRHILHKQLLAFGKKMYRLHTDSLQEGRFIKHPNQLISPHALGYAIKCGTVLPICVHFEKGKSAKDYMAKAEGLLGNVTRQLLEPYVPVDDTVSPGFGVEACCAG